MIKQFRKELKLSLTDMADYLGVNERTIRRWEKSEPPETVKMLIRAVNMIYEQGFLKYKEKPMSKLFILSELGSLTIYESNDDALKALGLKD